MMTNGYAELSFITFYNKHGFLVNIAPFHVLMCVWWSSPVKLLMLSLSLTHHISF